MSTKSKTTKKLSFGDMKDGMKVQGKITSIRTYGVVVRIHNSNNLDGLCHISEISDDQIDDINKYYQVC